MSISDLLRWDILTACCAVAVITIFYRANSGTKKLPPGPFRWPIIGNMNQMSGNMRIVFHRLRQKYGDIFSLQIGSQLYVIVNGFDALREVFVERADDFSDRSTIYSIRVLSKCKGVVSSRAENALPLRQVCRRSVNDKDKVREYLHDQLQVFDDVLHKTEGKPFNIIPILFNMNGNVLCGLMCGQTFQHDDNELKTCVSLIDESIKLTKITGIIDVFPFLLHLPGDLFKAKRLVENGDNMRKFASTLIEISKQNPERNCMIKDFLQSMENNGHLGEPYTNPNLLSTVNGMFMAGIQVGNMNLTWAVLHLINNKTLQDTLHGEVVNAIGSSAYPSENDRKLLPQCEAFVEEVLRYYDVSQFSVPHGTIKDVVLRDYVIPKGAVVLENLHSVMSDPRFFTNPDQFNYKRFLGPDGMFIPNDKVMPFGIGRRICLAYTTARTILLVIIVFLVQRYELLPAEDGLMPTMEGQFRFTHDPKPFQMRVKQR